MFYVVFFKSKPPRSIEPAQTLDEAISIVRARFPLALFTEFSGHAMMAVSDALATEKHALIFDEHFDYARFIPKD